MECTARFLLLEYTIDRTGRKENRDCWFGNTGQATAQIAEALGMEVWVYTSKPKKSLPKKYQKVTLNELFSACDVVSLHCPLTAEKQRNGKFISPFTNEARCDTNQYKSWRVNR